MADNCGYIEGTTGVNNADEVLFLADARPYDTFQIMSTAGAMNVFVSLDGTNFTTVALAMLDQGSTASTTHVVVTAQLRMYQFRGKFRSIRVRQSGATGVVNPRMMYGCM
jgi:hypothetical protein